MLKIKGTTSLTFIYVYKERLKKKRLPINCIVALIYNMNNYKYTFKML